MRYVASFGWALAAWLLALASFVYGWAYPNTHCAFICESNVPALAMTVVGAVVMLVGALHAALTGRWLALVASLASAPALAWVGLVAFFGGAR